MPKVMNTQAVCNNCWYDMTYHLETNYEDTTYKCYAIEGKSIMLMLAYLT